MTTFPRVRLSELGAEIRGSIAPKPGTVYAHYSIPSFDSGHPAMEDGGKIKSSKRSLQSGDVLISRINPRINRVWIVGEHGVPSIGSTEWVALRLHENSPVDAKYLLWYLRSPRFRSEITSSVSGVTGSHTRAKPKQILAYEVPLPSIGEQRAIVEAIERMLSHLDAGRAGLALRNGRVQSLRQSLLRQETSEGPIRRLAEVASTASGGTPRAGTASYYGGGIPWAVIGDLNDGVVSTTEKTITSEGLKASSAKWVEEGTLLIAMYGSIGKLGVAGRRLTTNQAIAAITPDPTILDSKFLFYRLMADRTALANAGKGGTQSNISQTILRDWRISVPPLDNQNEAVHRLDRALSVLEATQAALAEVDTQSTALRQSILKAAFDGRLESGSGAARLLDEAFEEVA